MHDVPLRPELTRKYTHLTPERVAAFHTEIESLSVLVPNPPKAFQLPRDPNDAMFLDLAIVGQADYVVTWNERHLTYLMKADTPEGKSFCSRFPGIHILPPPAFLHALDTSPSAQA
jgi:predicted nucleic acid-binding protein